MKSSLVFLICLAEFYLTLSDSSKIALDLKKNQSQLGSQMDIVFFKTHESHSGKLKVTSSNNHNLSNSPDDIEGFTFSWANDYNRNRPYSKMNKAENTYDDENMAVYSFKKEAETVHQDKKTAKKFREKTNVLKNTKQINIINHHQKNLEENKNRERHERKERKNYKKREYVHKNIVRDPEEPDPALNIPTDGIRPVKIAKELYEIDPILNMLRSNDNTRRQLRKKDSSSDDYSSSHELENFKKQFSDLWLQKKFEALNSTLPEGDQVNMGGARPWGVKCGDPNQHDMPWGSCMLAMECEPEYRIYRGDLYCGRTSFVCCALELTTYDMYQGFDVSFEGKSLSTDTEELFRDEGKYRGNKKKRKSARLRRKKKIKQTIRNIIKEINKILNRVYTNATKRRKRKSKQLKRFIKLLKTEYKKNRHVVQDLHEQAIVKIDTDLMKKLYDIKEMNHNFMRNKTFADIVVNGTMTKTGARMLIQAYPELQDFIDRTSPAPIPIVRMADARNRRFGGAAALDSKEKPELKSKEDYLEYDVEYGFLYY